MAEVSDVAKVQTVVVQNRDGRIVTMDSMTYVGADNFSSDVIVAGSFIGAMPIRCWVRRVDPKGVIGHAAGTGRNMAGISGLWALEALDIPAAAAETFSCRISDGDDLYDNGRVGPLNGCACDLGIVKGMSVREAARLMLARRRRYPDIGQQNAVLQAGGDGNIVAMGSVSFITLANERDVICAGSHFGSASAAYSSRFVLRGVICNDAGGCKDNSGIAGLAVLDGKGIPGAAVAAESAEIGDGASTYHDGVVSALNEAARSLGIVDGMSAREAAGRMLARAL